MIWYITNVDTEVLALRTAIESLPEGFAPVRGAQPCGPWTARWTSRGARCVLVRLLRGRQAWEEGFADLRADCPAAGDPARWRSAARRCPTPNDGTLDGAQRDGDRGVRLSGQRRTGNFEHLLRFVADTVLLEGYGFDAPKEIDQFGIWRRYLRPP